APPSMLVAMYVAARLREASVRASYQRTVTYPVAGSTTTDGMNCGRTPSVNSSYGESSLTRLTGGRAPGGLVRSDVMVSVRPLFTEYPSRISVSRAAFVAIWLNCDLATAVNAT